MFLLLITGCSKTPELSYTGEEEIYVCTKEDVDLLNSNVNVIAKVNQGFLVVDDKDVWEEHINHVEDLELKYREKSLNKKNVSACYFINYDNMKNKFGTLSPILFMDEELGKVSFHLKGEYEYTIYNMPKYYGLILKAENVDNVIDNLYRKINSEVIAAYTLKVNSKTFAEIQLEKKFDEDMLNKVNESIKDLYGIEIKNIDIHKIERIN
jgi:hypothetical protein